MQIHKLNDKQCRSRSVGVFRSQLIWIYTVCKGRAYPGSAGPGLRGLTLHPSRVKTQNSLLINKNNRMISIGLDLHMFCKLPNKQKKKKKKKKKNISQWIRSSQWLQDKDKIFKWMRNAQTWQVRLDGPRKVPLHVRKMRRLISSCACAKYRPGICSPFIDSVVSNDYAGGQPTLIRLCACADWSGPWMFAYARRYIFAWRSPDDTATCKYLTVAGLPYIGGIV